jgi:VanZ family protein
LVPWLLFLVFLVLWTWKLLEPSPVPEAVAEEIPTDLKFVLSKVVHAGAYAFLTVLAAFLPVRRFYFWMAVATLALHGIGTEIGQTYVPNRHGCVRDVLIDWLGIGLGLLALAWVGPLRRGAVVVGGGGRTEGLFRGGG